MKAFMINTDEGWQEFITFEAAKAFAEKLSWEDNKPINIHCPDGKVITIDINK